MESFSRHSEFFPIEPAPFPRKHKLEASATLFREFIWSKSMTVFVACIRERLLATADQLSAENLAALVCGANLHVAILRDGISIASSSFIGAGSVVTSDITESGLYYGNPAKKQQQSALEACIY